MTAVDDPAPVFLSLDTLTPNRDVALSLPGDVARLYHALPVAQDNGRVTVVMANPGDQTAREAVVAALTVKTDDARGGASSVYVVQGDPAAIDVLLAELWPASEERPELQVWLREPLHGEKKHVVTFAENVAGILDTSLARFNPLTNGLPQAIRAATDTLVILPCGDIKLRSQLLHSGEGQGPAVLIGCQTRWPLRKVLVIVRGDEVDDMALVWAARLARPSGAALTALMVALPAPAGHHETDAEGIAALLTGTNATGHRMKRTAQRLAALHLDATLHLRQGVPESVIREELATDDYDLAIAGIAVRGWEAQWRLRPFLDRLLQDAFCPLLIVKA